MLLASFALIAAACSSDGASSTIAEPAATEAAPATDAPAATEPAPAATDAPDDTEPAATDAPVDSEPAATDDDPAKVFPTLAPPTGEPIKVGLVNSEGSPGLDFPDIRTNVSAAVDYLNEHGGLGNRPIELVHCAVNGAPDTSQACAQELTGKGVELVLLGLDLFPDYATYTAADVPVIGMLPILPGDYAANALFLTGGNATTMASIAAVAKDHFGAATVGIVSADNAGANASEASLTASLDAAGIAHTTVKGGDNETDAGYQGLMRQAADGDPDVIISLYADAGCIGTIRGRASLGIDTPVITTSICADADVIAEVGDDAIGWVFAGIQTTEDTPEKLILQEVVAPALGIAPEEVDPTALGLGGLGVVMTMSLAVYSNAVVAAGGDLTGKSLYEYLGTTPALQQWPSGSLVECGQSETYSAICAFTFPFAEYLEGGQVLTVPGLEAVSSIAYLP
ncbi:ABC transporter substrate-binding protein [Ilumatobacter sp.]|uniref:ABC transporter substrate-binding protein n=1 Tax=Ilumatobacter sp. TaxID=1967498 RepID=UPI00375315E2